MIGELLRTHFKTPALSRILHDPNSLLIPRVRSSLGSHFSAQALKVPPSMRNIAEYHMVLDSTSKFIFEFEPCRKEFAKSWMK